MNGYMANQEVEQAVIDNQKLVHFVIKRYFQDLRDDEDIFQVGWIGLWKACISYDSSRSKFATYAIRCITNEIRMELRDRAKLWGFGDIASLNSKLSKRDVNVFKLSIAGFTAAEIGRAFGHTRAWASAIIKKAQTMARA